MHSLTLHQPWATAIAHLGKDVENRTWCPPSWVLGHVIAIHAGKMCRRDDVRALAAAGFVLPHPLPSGFVALAKVRGWVAGTTRKLEYGGPITRKDALAARKSDWFLGPIGWMLGDVRALESPVPAIGYQGLWRVPRALESQLEQGAQS